MIQYRFQVEKLLNVPAGAFRPLPKVESAFVRLVPQASLALQAADERLFGAIVAKAFSQRRKTLRNALAEFVSEAELAELGVEARLRPENLSVETFVRLAQFAAHRASRHAAGTISA
jgi:16S rRNA (adenine1518-N6/adenine1519-N6)-dimethyltransferase